MNKGIHKKTKHQPLKFKDAYDETLDWEEEQELRIRRRKLGKKSQWKNNTRDKW